MSFTHLEVHSHFTLLGATPSVAELAARAAADGLSHLALTDTNALYGAVAFARACRGHAVQPIIGMTLTLAPVETLHATSLQAAPAGHLVLLARGPAGYRSLCRLSSLIQGRPDRAALAERGLTLDDLAAHRDGLICLSGGRMGWVARCLRAGDRAGAQLYAGRLAGIFDEDAYLALELGGPEDGALAAEVAALGRRLGMPTVAVQPIYCLSPDDAPRLRLLAAIRANRPLGAEAEDDAPDGAEDDDADGAGVAERGWRDGAARPPRAAQEPGQGVVTGAVDGAAAEPLAGRHWLSPAEMAARFAAFGGACARAGEVAERCGAALPDGRPIWPALTLPPGQTPDDALTALAEAGLAEKYAPPATPDAIRNPQFAICNPQSATVASRLAHELAAITEHGYAPLFLVVVDIVRTARSRGIPVSTRGSVANSLVAYCTGITTVDPIEHGLLFERFLSPARADPPDIDLDFCSRRRDEVLAYVRQTYGAEHVALVGTFSTLQPQGAVREVAKAFGLSDAEIARILALLPHRWHPDPRRRDRRTVEDVIAALEDERLRRVVRAAYSLVGQPDHLSVHPGGTVITPGPLTDTVPVQWAPKGFLITQFEHGDVEALGLPKIDLLGIRALTVLAHAAELAQGRDPAFRLEQIPLDDAATGEMLARGGTIGVFQCESEGAQRTLRKLRAHTVRDLAVANAFFKPGPATGGMASAFVRRYRGQERVTYLHPALAAILGPTQGVLIFQEQILRLATEIAGLSWAQADHLRRGMSKFRPEEMTALAEQFSAGCRRPPPDGPGLSKAQAQTLWEQVAAFAGYGFNQGHATAYADVSYRSAFIKTHFPAEFLCARLAEWGGFHHPVIYAAEAVRLGIPVRPPHVNFSGHAFALLRIADSGLRIDHPPSDAADKSIIRNPQSAILFMGLGQVRDLRDGAVAALLAERAHGAFTGVRDLLARVALQAKEILHLIRCGALDGLPALAAGPGGASRAALLVEAAGFGRRNGRSGQMAFDLGAPDVPTETLAERLAWEQQILGWPVSVTPLDVLAGALPAHTPLRCLAETPGRALISVGFRLPGWTGGAGYFVGDGDTFVQVKPADEGKAPPAWQPLLLRGRWVLDEWGGGCFQAGAVTLL